MDGESDVLVHSGIAPPDSLRVGIGCVVGFDTRKLAHLPLALADFFQIDPCARHALELVFFIRPPASHVVRTGDHARGQPFGDPGVQYEEADFGVHLD